MRPNIIQNKRYYNMTNWAGGGFDISVKRTKPDSWIEKHKIRQRKLVENGQHLFTSEHATKWATLRLQNKTHHFLHSNFNKRPFILYKNDIMIGMFESKVHAVKDGWPSHLIDKLRKYGEWTINEVCSKYKSMYKQGDIFKYGHLS